MGKIRCFFFSDPQSLHLAAECSDFGEDPIIFVYRPDGYDWDDDQPLTLKEVLDEEL